MKRYSSIVVYAIQPLKNGEQSGVDNIEVNHETPLFTYEDFRNLEKMIAEEGGFHSVVITNVIPLGDQ